MIKIEANLTESLLLIHYEGKITREETSASLPQIPTALLPLTRGFRVLVDLTDLVSMEVACAPDIERFMDLCQEKGVAEIVRVIPDPTRDIGLQIMSHFHYDSGVRIITCRNLTEAMAILSSPS